jgi:hypothetical protein
MRWRNRNWPERTPRPKAAKLSKDLLQQLHARAEEFVAQAISGSFQGTCLYALHDGQWGCYTIKPSAFEIDSCPQSKPQP